MAKSYNLLKKWAIFHKQKLNTIVMNFKKVRKTEVVFVGEVVNSSIL